MDIIIPGSDNIFSVHMSRIWMPGENDKKNEKENVIKCEFSLSPSSSTKLTL